MAQEVTFFIDLLTLEACMQILPNVPCVADASGKRTVQRCDFLGHIPFSDTSEGLFRSYLSPAYMASVKQVRTWMEEAGMHCRIDAAGNLIGRYEALTPNAPALLIGSHLDSVKNAGKYDGTLGVILGIEAIARFHAQQKRFPFAIEIIGFGDEEGSRFPVSMLTSRAVAGSLDTLPDVQDTQGTSIQQALQERGLDPACYLEAAYKPSQVLAYFEAHIEQGPVLESTGHAVGLVTSIAAQYRFKVTMKGMAGHAGTLPMHLRQDALAAAAEAICCIEKIAQSGPNDLVATVGQMSVKPGAPNIVPGWVEFSIDVRAGTEDVRNKAAETLTHALQEISQKRGVEMQLALQHDLSATQCNPQLSNILAASIQTVTGQPAYPLVSGAGHDAMIMAALAPVCMLFIRCEKGISHNPAEAVQDQDVETALRVMCDFIQNIPSEKAI
ncbi:MULTISPECIES: allantoate amidohydrolase [Acetobacter]|uniref:Allantoate amidohydrolase n=2 Tax=Acetobacter TaxID=434 RepID=A0AAN1PHJ0_9PROT|nr:MULTISPECIES: allantoate amidohydrolase [Acetobacter]ASL40192.1 allantoate amidohydrolase [Acetobacter oryzifermentans]AXN00373.1 allantoate amidohydrolase [Acetobacter pomorum]KAA8399275.1 allantoate amidohydrolase [Acetobacter sp. DmW_125127]KAA8400049.1 allantoate amidohydrolase [Acetobacter sp. DmW_125128]KAA8400828.1 allantoate amidohydrolase [Acetobacter sp. DmW_125124]